jgi:hypothetical protein
MARKRIEDQVMTNINIRLVKSDEDIVIAQEIFNSKESVNYLGGFTMRDAVAQAASSNCVIIGSIDGKDVAASEATRNGSQRTSLQLVATLEPYRRRHLTTAMYWTWTLLTAVQGRVHLTDHIIDNNPVMPHVLPTLGFKHAAALRSKVRRHHAMNLWVYDMLKDGLTPFRNRITDLGDNITFDDSFKVFQEEFAINNFNKNIAILAERDDQVGINQLTMNRTIAAGILGW